MPLWRLHLKGFASSCRTRCLGTAGSWCDLWTLQVALGWQAGMQQLLDFVQTEYLPSATDEPGLCAQPNGEVLYKAYLR